MKDFWTEFGKYDDPHKAAMNRIEELKEYIRQHVGVTECVDFHNISNDQIRKIWKKMLWHEQRGSFHGENRAAARALKEMLAEFNIHRCEKCSGEGYTAEPTWPDGEPEQVQCEACYGEGWVVGETEPRKNI